MPNLLDLSFIIKTIVKALLVISSSDTNVLLRRIHILQTLQQTWYIDVLMTE